MLMFCHHHQSTWKKKKIGQYVSLSWDCIVSVNTFTTLPIKVTGLSTYFIKYEPLTNARVGINVDSIFDSFNNIIYTSIKVKSKWTFKSDKYNWLLSSDKSQDVPNYHVAKSLQSNKSHWRLNSHHSSLKLSTMFTLFTIPYEFIRLYGIFPVF